VGRRGGCADDARQHRPSARARFHQRWGDLHRRPRRSGVEIVSPESDARDRGDKFVEYEAAGIPEYWLIDLVRRETDLYHLDAESRYRRIAPDAAGVYESVLLPGLRLKPDWLWRQPVPTLEVRLGRSRRATRRATTHSAMRRAR
jgi:hypothetical protein